MIWLNPWAWIGLIMVGLPIAIHLLTRAEPRPQPFPTLRFLGATATTAVRRRALRDRVLLAVRAATVAAVVAAGARPYFGVPGTVPAGAASSTSLTSLTRAVVIDTSASLQRTSTDGRSAIDVARARAGQLEPTAATSVSIDVDRLPEGLARATTWLQARAGRREIVVLSDFQRGALAQADVASVPAGIGVRLITIDTAPVTAAVAPDARIGDRVWTPRLTLDPDRTTVAWQASLLLPEPGGDIRVLARPADAVRIAAAVAAVRSVGTAARPERHPVVLVLPGATDRAAILSGAGAIDQRWMFSTVERVRHDATLGAASDRTLADRSVPAGPRALAVVARDRTGSPLLEAASRHGATEPQAPDLLLIASSDDSLFVSALLASISRPDVAALSELEPLTIPPEALATWQRATPLTPTPGTGSGPSSEDSDGRWFWIGALTLLAIEGWMRRTPSGHRTAPAEVTHARVA
jgi:hypothetical protein